MFSFSNLIVACCRFRYLICYELIFFIRCKFGILICTSAYEDPISQPIWWRHCPFYQGLISAYLYNICWFYMLRLFSEISNLFCWSTRHCFVFISDCFDCIFLKCLLESGSVITSGLFLVFKIVSDIRGLLCFHMNFIIDFFFLDQWRMFLIFWLGFHWFCKQLWVAWILIY